MKRPKNRLKTYNVYSIEKRGKIWRLMGRVEARNKHEVRMAAKVTKGFKDLDLDIIEDSIDRHK